MLKLQPAAARVAPAAYLRALWRNERAIVIPSTGINHSFLATLIFARGCISFRFFSFALLFFFSLFPRDDARFLRIERGADDRSCRASNIVNFVRP